MPLAPIVPAIARLFPIDAAQQPRLVVRFAPDDPPARGDAAQIIHLLSALLSQLAQNDQHLG